MKSTKRFLVPPAPTYTFRNLKYAQLQKGVYVQGDVYLGDRKVSTFEQQPYAACIVSDGAHLGISTTVAERLLYEAEEKMQGK